MEQLNKCYIGIFTSRNCRYFAFYVLRQRSHNPQCICVSTSNIPQQHLTAKQEYLVQPNLNTHIQQHNDSYITSQSPAAVISYAKRSHISSSPLQLCDFEGRAAQAGIGLRPNAWDTAVAASNSEPKIDSVCEIKLQQKRVIDIGLR